MSKLNSITYRLRNAKVIEPKMPSEGYQTILGKQAADYIEELEERINETHRLLLMNTKPEIYEHLYPGDFRALCRMLKPNE